MKKRIAVILAVLILAAFIPTGSFAEENEYETLKVGTFGPAVKAVQERLVELGYLNSYDVDSSYGKGTERAIKKFQMVYGLPITGISDEATQSALFSGEKPDPAKVEFSATDRDGEKWDNSMFSDYKLIMINFWEPWCPPCEREASDLEKLYETYKDQGFLILGFCDFSFDEDIDRITGDAGTSYPILPNAEAENLSVFATGYVPTTFFVDSNGNVLRIDRTAEELNSIADYLQQSGANPLAASSLYIGSRSFDSWAAIVEALLAEQASTQNVEDMDMENVLGDSTWTALDPEEDPVNDYVQQVDPEELEEEITEEIESEPATTETGTESSETEKEATEPEPETTEAEKKEKEEEARKFLYAAISDDAVSYGIIDFDGQYKDAEEDYILVPIYVRDLEVGQQVKAVLSNGSEYELVCMKEETVWVPFPKDADNIGYVIYLL